jgi:AraC-like DNA-binding protein
MYLGNRPGRSGWGRCPMDIPLDFTRVRFASDDLPTRDRLPAWRDLYGPRVNGADVEPVAGIPFRTDVTLRALPGFGLTTTQSTPARYARTRRFLADGRDHFGIHLSFAGGACGQRDREITCDPGHAVLMNVAEAGWIVSRGTMLFWGLWFSRARLAPLVTGLDDRVLQPIPSDTEPMRYLIGYVRNLEAQQCLADAEIARMAAIHLHDLFALVLGANRDAAFIAQRRGLHAARVRAVKRYIVDNLGHVELDVHRIAARHRLTPRSVQRLFESEGTTFSEYVLNKRLARVLRMLADPAYARWTVSAIALEAGFGDVSYFNRRFRRRFGAPPMHFRSRNGGADGAE